MIFAVPAAPICKRVKTPEPRIREFSGVNPRYSIENAAWLWHPEVALDEPAFLLFRLDFNWKGGPFCFQTSADQRFFLGIDGELAASGPDSSDPARWAFATYQVNLDPGKHRIDAIVWWAGGTNPIPGGIHRQLKVHAPMSRMTWRGGLVFAGPQKTPSLCHTGFAPWRVTRLQGAQFEGGDTFNGICHVVGSPLKVDVAAFHDSIKHWKKPVCVANPVAGNPFGLVAPGWRMEPSELPEQLMSSIRPGTVRMVIDEAPRLPLRCRELPLRGREAICSLWEKGKPLTLEPGRKLSIMVDLKDYFCGYPMLRARTGDKLTVQWLWAESLYERDGLAKGNRDEVDGKFFKGFGDTFVFSSKSTQPISSHWWRAGRYLLLIIENGNAVSEIAGAAIQRTGYPLKVEAAFDSSDPSLRKIWNICLNGVRASVHEVFCDSPYYEAMTYVADARINSLVSYQISRDDRLVRRCIDLLDGSRQADGWLSMRYPSLERQTSVPFSMIWVWMVHDYAWWRNDPAWWLQKLNGVRAVLNACEQLERNDGLLDSLPGWSFIDWVPGWNEGVPFDPQRDCSAAVNAMYLYTLKCAAELETIAGHMERGALLQGRYDKIKKSFEKVFWDKNQLRYRDGVLLKTASAHTQAFAAMAGLEKGFSRGHPADQLSVYFLNFFFEVLCRRGKGSEVLRHLQPWHEMVSNGLRAPIEGPEPARSDCHSWASHPLFHLSATVAGIRPGSPGFETVSIRPQPGTLNFISVKTPHPKGEVALRMEKKKTHWLVECSLPKDTPGHFEWRNKRHPLLPGTSFWKL